MYSVCINYISKKHLPLPRLKAKGWSTMLKTMTDPLFEIETEKDKETVGDSLLREFITQPKKGTQI